MKTKLSIKSIWGSLLFELECENNSIKNTLLEAIKSGANLRHADLSGAYLSRADLSGANLRCANLSGANLSGAYLSGANLSGANLRCANLSGANLRCANLRCANLSGANLSGANLRCANLSGADLSGANLSGADHNESTGFLLCQCPSEGSFIAWKKCDKYIVKLQVCEDAKRSSATTLKCRCSKALCLDIQNFDGSKSDINAIRSDKSSSFIYHIGEINDVLDFDDDRFNECSTGIHFFISREMAVKYN